MGFLDFINEAEAEARKLIDEGKKFYGDVASVVATGGALVGEVLATPETGGVSDTLIPITGVAFGKAIDKLYNDITGGHLDPYSDTVAGPQPPLTHVDRIARGLEPAQPSAGGDEPPNKRRRIDDPFLHILDPTSTGAPEQPGPVLPGPEEPPEEQIPPFAPGPVIVNPTPAPTPIMGGTYRTPKYSGYGKFNKAKYRKAGKYATNGGQVRVEGGGVITANKDQTVYIHHSPVAMGRLFKVMCHAIVRTLAKKMNIHFQTWTEEVYNQFTTETSTNAGLIVFYYMITDSTGTVSGYWQTDVEANETWLQVSAAISSDLQTNIAALDPDFVHTLRIKSVHWVAETGGTPAAISTPMAKIDLQTSKIQFYATSLLQLQNRTPAEDTAGADDHRSTNNVEANPLCGKAYRINGMNTLKMKTNWSTDSAFLLAPDKDSGMAVLDSAEYTYDTTRLHPPPQQHVFLKCNRTAPINLNPGQIKQDKLNIKGVMWFNQFLHKIKYFMLGSNNQVSHFGTATTIALEKMMHTGTSDPNMVIGYEKHAFYGCVLKTTRTLLPSEHDTTGIVDFDKTV